MAVRFYLMPIITDGIGRRAAKYFFAISNPDGLNVSYGIKTYGIMPVCIVAADVTNGQHNGLIANSDVRAIPANIDNAIGAGQVANVRSVLEDLGIPGNWVGANDTWRNIIRMAAGLFEFADVVGDRYSVRLIDIDIALDTTWSQLPQGAKNILLETAQSLGIDTSGATGNTTLRQIYKAFGDAWGNRGVLVWGLVI